MKILITGGCGFIGSEVCRHFVGALGHTVLNIDVMTYAANPANVRGLSSTGRYEHVKVDVCDRAAIEAVVTRFKPEAVVHLAAESHVDRSITGPAAFIQTNVVGTYTMLEAVRQYFDALDPDAKSQFRFIHVSTDEVYGSLGDSGYFTEETAYDPRSPYSASKAASDHLAAAWFETYGLPTIITNCSNNYGPYHFPEKLIPLTILNALEGAPLPIYGDGGNVRDWLHVSDHARGIAAALEKGRPGEKYNFGGDAEHTNLAVVLEICEELDRLRPEAAPHRALIQYVPDRPGHDRRYAIDHSKATRELGWTPRRTFREGIAATVDWYIDNQDWWRPLRQSVYAGQRLGLLAREN